MKKRFGKLLTLVMVLCLLLPAAVLGEGEPRDIAFRGVVLGSTAEEAMSALDVKDGLMHGYDWASYRIEDIGASTAIGLTSPNGVTPFATDIALSTWVNDVEEVGGYKPEATELVFVRPVTENGLEQDDNKAIFYGGDYIFTPESKQQQDQYKDLAGKLTKLYGKGEQTKGKGRTATVWQGANNTTVILTTYDNVNVITLTYALANGNELVQAAVDYMEKQQSAKPTVDPNSTNGL